MGDEGGSGRDWRGLRSAEGVLATLGVLAAVVAAAIWAIPRLPQAPDRVRSDFLADEGAIVSAADKGDESLAAGFVAGIC